MSDPLETHPASTLLLLARNHVRSRWRSKGYYAAGDRFSELFLGEPFKVEPDYYKVVGTDYSLIDALYEELGCGGELARESPKEVPGRLKDVTLQLQEMAVPERASAALATLQVELQKDSCSMLDVTRALLGPITVLGVEALAARGCSAQTEDWLKLWQEYLWRQNQQQEHHNGLCLLRRASDKDRQEMEGSFEAALKSVSVKGLTFAQGVRKYLEGYSETGASAVALIGGLPFSKALSAEGLRELLLLLKNGEVGFLGRITSMLRLAQDVKFDPSEPLNSGVMGYAVSNGLDLLALNPSTLPVVEIETALRREWDTYFAECRQEIDTQVASVEEATLKSALQLFVKNLYSMASTLSKTTYKG